MKYLSLLFLTFWTASGQEFLTGQAARMTIGQVTFTEQNETPTQYVLGAVDGVAFANNMLVVVDSNHIQATPVQNRVLIYNNISRFMLPPTSEVPQGSRCPLCVGSPQVGGADVVLGQPDFVSSDINLTQTGMRTPTGVATDGKIIAVSDTDNNRVLIWTSIPTTDGAPANIVLGQPDFTTFQSPPPLDAKSFRGPEGIWIQGGRLFVADTQNHRVMVWNSIPTTNNQPADYVLGQPNLTTSVPSTTLDLPPTANNLFSPVSVTSDGQRLFVTDLGHTRVLIWNSIPTQNQQPADLVVGQPDMVSEFDNNSPALCASYAVDSNNNPLYPTRCAATLSVPRYALSDGQRLFIADGGNDRVLVYNSIPTRNGQPADVILGQPDDLSDVVTDSTDTFRPDANILSSSPNTVRTPLALAWDGTNLFVSDPFDRRVLAFTPGTSNVPINGITNAASQNVYALGSVEFAGTITAKDTVTVTITASGATTGTNYTYTVVAADTLITVVQNMANLINGTNGGTPDPNVLATPNPGFDELILASRIPGANGNNISYATSVSTNATITATVTGATLAGGSSAAEVSPGTLVTIMGTNLSDSIAQGVPDSRGFYPTSLGGVEVYFDGIRAPLLYVSPTQINTQIPLAVTGSNGISAFVRTLYSNGKLINDVAVSVPVVQENPGIFAEAGQDPRPAIAFHASSKSIAVVSVDGTVTPGDSATLNIEDRSYTYSFQATDTLTTVRDAFVVLINDNPNEKVTASASEEFTRIILTAKIGGPFGDGIAITASTSTSATITLSVLGAGSTCCGNIAGARITADNPAVPGEVIYIYATGIGITTLADNTTIAGTTGQIYQGPAYNLPRLLVDNAQVGGATATVLTAGLKPGLLGVYEVQLQLGSSLPTNPNTQMYIAQNVFTSNIVTIPVVAP
jgi:hypothetical protein